MEIINWIMAVLVACGVGRAMLEHMGIKKGQKVLKKPFDILARIVLSPLELVLYLFSLCLLASPFDKEKNPYRKRRK